MDRARLLIVDVDPVIRTSLARYLALRGYEAIAVGSAAEALELLRSPGVDAVLDGLPLASAGAGWRLLCTGRELDPTLVLIVMVTYSDMACAVEAMREGAFCFLEKPFDAADMEVHLVKALEHRRLQREVAGLRAQLQQAARSVAAELAPPRGAGPAEPSPPPAPPAPSAQDPLPLDVASLPLALPEQGI
ncbi:MAG: response regulator, partial [Deltaproteobacteria bacterium]|nr:response regulator [Deltaproteobacteria bacterium]